MLTVTSIIGNVFHDKSLRKKYKHFTGNCEMLTISRLEAERSRLRRKTNKGTDIGIVLKSGTKLQHGDILLSTSEKFIVVEQLPEKVITIRIKKKESKNLLKLCMMIGHIIGNRHRPIAIDEKGTISFPIQAESEIDVFRRLLHNVMDHIELTVEERIFQPEQGMDVHEH